MMKMKKIDKNDVEGGIKELQKIAKSKVTLPEYHSQQAEEEVKNLIHILNISTDDRILLTELNKYGVYFSSREEVIERIEFYANSIPLRLIQEIKMKYPVLSKEIDFHV